MEALPPASAPIEHLEVLALTIIRPGLVSQRESRLDHVGDIDQHGCSALLPRILDDEVEVSQTLRRHRLADPRRRYLMRHLVASERLKSDWLQNMDLLDHPADRRLPV